MNERQRKDLETRARILLRRQRWSTVRLLVMVSVIVVAAVWWLVENLRS